MLKPLFGAIAATATTAFLVTPVTAATVFYDTKFFDQTGTQVGFGEFSYDPDDSYVVSYFPPLQPPITIAVNNPLSFFRATIQGVEIVDNSPHSFFAPTFSGAFWQNEKPFELGFSASPRIGISYFTSPGWSFGNLTLQDGVWSGIGDGGTWKAIQRNDEAVPEPATVVGSLVGLAWLARKRLTAASTHDSEQ